MGEKKVLIVVDMQNDFIDGALGTKEAAAIVPDAAKKIRAFDGEIVCTMDTHGSDYLSTQEGRKLPVPHCIKGTKGWELNPEIRTALEENNKYVRTFEKPTFGSMELADFLTDRGYTDISVIGLCTDICVISNVLLAKAALSEARIVVDASCCAGVSRESHENALFAMKACQVEVENE